MIALSTVNFDQAERRERSYKNAGSWSFVNVGQGTLKGRIVDKSFCFLSSFLDGVENLNADLSHQFC